jgi:WD40 repeat protein
MSSLRGGAVLITLLFFGAWPSFGDKPKAEQKPGAKTPKKERLDPYGDPLPPGAIQRFGSRRLRHTRGVSSLVFLPDGKSLFSGGSAWAARQWDVATGKLLQEFRVSPYQQSTDVLALSPNGKVLATGGSRGPISLWDLPSGKELRKLQGSGNFISSLAFSSNGKKLAAGNGHWVQIWDGPSGLPAVQCKGHTGKVNSVVFSPDDKTVISGSDDQTVRFWKVATGKEERDPLSFNESVYFVGNVPGSKTLVTQEWRGEIRYWDVVKGVQVRNYNPQGGYRPAFSPNGKTFACGGKDWCSIGLYDVVTGKELRTFKGHGSGFFTVAFSPDGKTLASGSSIGAIRLWDVASGKEKSPDLGHEGLSGFGFSADGKILAAGSIGGAHLWDVKTGKRRSVMPVAGDFLTFCEDGNTVASVTRSKAGYGLSLWNIYDPSVVRTIPLKDVVIVDFFCSCGKWAAFLDKTDSKGIFLWDLTKGSLRHKFPVGWKRVRSIAFTPDGKTLAVLESSDYQFDIFFWDVATGKEIGKVASDGKNASIDARAITFSPDGKTLVLNEHGLKFRDVASGRILFRWDQTASQMRFSPDGRILALESRTGSPSAIQLREVATGEIICTFEGYQGRLDSMTFTPDSKALATAERFGHSILLRSPEAFLGVDEDFPAKGLGEEMLKKHWLDLEQRNAAAGYRAVCLLASAPKETIPFLKDRLKAVPPQEDQRLEKLFADLGSDKFQTRDAAFKELKKLGIRAESVLRQALPAKLPIEVRKRIDLLLEGLNRQSLPKGWLQEIRGVQVLERIGSPEARQLLETLAKGATLAQQTQDARAALQRLKRVNREP